MTVNLSAYSLLVFAYILMVFNWFVMIRKYEKLNKENEELKESICILRHYLKEYLTQEETNEDSFKG